jgi:hypothetical protein
MSYEIQYDTSLAPPRAAAIVSFMQEFYRTSDTESLHEKYVENFTADATLIMGPKEAKGTDGMVPTRTSRAFTIATLHTHLGNL